MRRSVHRLIALAVISLLLGLEVSGVEASGRQGRIVPNPSVTPADQLSQVKARDGASAADVHRTGAPLPRTPSETFGFDAIFNQPPYAIPADPTGAVSDTWYLTAVNSHVAVYDLTGTPDAAFDPPLRLKNNVISGASFPSGTTDFDPKVVYDPYNDEFILVYLAVNDSLKKSWIVIAGVPDATADDIGTWCIRKVKGDQVQDGNTSWSDYPLLGFTATRVTVSTNLFGFGSFPYHGAQILSFAKSKLYDCGQSPSPKVFGEKKTLNPDGSRAFTIQPAVTNGGVSPTTQYLLSFDFGTMTGKTLVLWRLRKSGGGLKLSKVALGVGQVTTAPSGTQCNGTTSNPNTWWDTGDLRLINAFYDADLDRVYAAHAIEKDIAPSGYVESAIRWYEVAPAGTLSSSTVEKGIVGVSRLDAGWPTLATDSSGNLFIAFSGASAPDDVCLSAYAGEVNTATDAYTTAQLTAGVGRFEATSGTERWGDFNAVSRDPADGTKLAMVNAYPVDDGAGSALTTYDWQQVVDVVTSV